MQQQQRVEKLLAWFARAAVCHAEAMDVLDEEESARLTERLDSYFTAVNREGSLDQFLTLLEHENPAVSGMAAVYAMREAPQRCQVTLSQVARTPGMLGFRAKAALEMWESGQWPR
jgi:hypothetical protein